MFNKTFKKDQEGLRGKKDFEKKYLNNFLNFSFHGIMKSKNEIVGCYNIIPYEFTFFSEKKLFGQSVDTTIHSAYRGNIYNLKKLVNLVYEEIKKHKIFFVYGLPNEKFYLVKQKILGWKNVGELEYYIYPINIKNFFEKLSFLNNILYFFVKSFIKFKFVNNYKYKFFISKIYNKSINLTEYSNNHKIVSNSEYKLIYKEVIKKNYNNAKIIYIIDVLPLTKKNIENSVDELIRTKQDIDSIVYVGWLKKTPYNLFKIPKFFFRKKQINVSGKILDTTQIQEVVFDISNWNINLSNFDIK